MTTYEYFAADLVLTLMYKCNLIFYLMFYHYIWVTGLSISFSEKINTQKIV